MILIAFAFLLPSPIHEKTEVRMNHRYSDDHVRKNPKGCDSGQETEKQADAAAKFGCDRKKCEESWNVQSARKEAHCTGEAVSAEPPQHFLGTMREENYTEHQAENSRRDVSIGCNYSLEHWRHAPQQSYQGPKMAELSSCDRGLSRHFWA